MKTILLVWAVLQIPLGILTGKCMRDDPVPARRSRRQNLFAQGARRAFGKRLP